MEQAPSSMSGAQMSWDFVSYRHYVHVNLMVWMSFIWIAWYINHTLK
jgi:hypothetical protein